MSPIAHAELGWLLAVGVVRGVTLVEVFSVRGDAAFVQVLRIWRDRLRAA